jgi:hypothetical protein
MGVEKGQVINYLGYLQTKRERDPILEFCGM